MGSDLESLRARLQAQLAAMPQVRLAFLFGSRARGAGRHDSDFDIAVLLDDPVLPDPAASGRWIRNLAGRLGREVSSAHLDIVLLNDAPVVLRHRVLRDGVLLHERAVGERVRFATRTIREYQDGQVRRDVFTEHRIHRQGKEPRDGGPRDLLEKARSVARLLEQARRVP